MTFDYRELRALVAIADTGALGQAAGRVHLSQPALSRLVRTLEDRLGARLFERSRHGMEPTLFGETLMPHARLLLFEMEQAIEAVDAARGMRRGTLRIGAVSTIVRSILPQALERLHATLPGVQIELLDAPEDRLVAALEGRAIDVMIAGPLADSATTTRIVECRFDDSYMVLCSATHPLAERDTVEAEEALAALWIATPPGSAPRTLFEETLRGLGRPLPRIVIETVSPGAIAAIVGATAFLSWLPQPLFACEQAAGLVVPLTVPGMQVRRRFFVYRRASGLFPPIARAFVTHLPLLDEASHASS